MSNKIYVIKAYLEDLDEGREVSKYTTNLLKAKQIAVQLKEAAHLLGLGDKFKCELLTEEVEE